MTSSTYEVDPQRSANLGNGWRVAVAVGSDGDESCWLVSPAPDLPGGCACRSCAPHDQDRPGTGKASSSADTRSKA